MTQVYLVPGFFGFDRLGSINYFQGVSEVLREALLQRGVEARIVEVGTQPTSSIRRRAIRLLETVKAEGGRQDGDVHFVGHSTGGLDVRLLLTPGVMLEPDGDEVLIGEHTRSVTTIATPHFGTPLANFFTSLNGRNFLYLLMMLATSGPGRIGIYTTAQMLAAVAKADDFLGRTSTALDHFAERLLTRLHYDRSDVLNEFLHDVASDQGAMVQLTPESIDLFNASVPNREGTRYTSFLTAAPPPGMRITSLEPYDLLTSAIFRLAHAITSREHRHYPYPHPGEQVAQHLREQLPFDVSTRTNDGIVPTLSQVWGRIGGVAVGDHLDVVGQFPHDAGEDHYPGWLHSGAGFDEARFRTFWSAVADEIAASSTGTRG